MKYQVEALMSARLFVVPQYADGRVYFLSNLSGHLSLYSMSFGGSVPEPLLPPQIALQNPLLVGGHSFFVFPKLNKALVMIDSDGDENYLPMLIPLEGGFPEDTFDHFFSAYRVHLTKCDTEKNIAYFVAERRDRAVSETYRGNLKKGTLEKIAENEFPIEVLDHSRDHRKLLLGTTYLVGDAALYFENQGDRTLLYGSPLENRKEGETVPLNGLTQAVFSPSETAALIISSVFEDTYSLGYIDLARPGELERVRLKGVKHEGVGELEQLERLNGDRYLLVFNIDGCSWVYEGVFNEKKKKMSLKHILVGREPLDSGMLQRVHHDKQDEIFTFSFSSATTPTQLYSISSKKRRRLTRHTNERILGIPGEYLSKGEDASFISYDGLRVSARLYLPPQELGFEGPRPLVYYIHGGPRGQERPDFAWFSMPLIQFLALRGFAVFVPNVRGSTGYGLSYAKHVDRDWGGQDRLDHVHAMTQALPNDKRLDVNCAAVVGRSYGGYMTLMLAVLHPDLWKAACDMFGPYDLLTFSERIPETWKPYFRIALGDPATAEGRAFLTDRSPRTHLQNIAAPMLVVQGRNDPRVVAAESEDLVNELRAQGKDLELLIFEDEGHDVLKYENRVRCYNAIAEFFARYLAPES